MVFSMNLVAEDRLGSALVVQYKQRVNDLADLLDEAQQLWAAERDSFKSNRRIAAKDPNNYWGGVGLLVNPERPVPDRLLDGWAQAVSQERACYEALTTASSEQPVVNGSGMLQFPWPTAVDGPAPEIDLLLATPTNPTIVGGHYPSPCAVADAWNTIHGKEHAKYFEKNRENGITTCCDDVIEFRLRELRT